MTTGHARVHPSWGRHGVCKQFVWLEIVSVKIVLSRPGTAPGWCPIPPPAGNTSHWAVHSESQQTLVNINLELQRFEPEHYAEYASWFTDPELSHHLGPMDQVWLDSTLSQPASAGVTWAVFRGIELVAVVETVFDLERRLPAGIMAIAVKPGLRRQGIGTTVLHQILFLHKSQGI